MVGEFVAQPLSGGFLLGELVDHNEVDILRDRACDRDGRVGKTGGIQFARHGTAAERLADRDLAAGHEVDGLHADLAAASVLDVALDDTADALTLPHQVLREVGEQRVEVILRPVENGGNADRVDLGEINGHGSGPCSASYACMLS
ncbi:hypothetical protein FHR88_000148 [Bradyrhizobium betae]|nr:hypothetical protein [Bradyrhizobium betae]